MMVLWEYVFEIPSIGWKEFSHSTTNRIISIQMCPGTLFNVRVLYMDLARYLITLICIYISGKFSAAAVVLRVNIPGIIILIFSKSLSI